MNSGAFFESLAVLYAGAKRAGDERDADDSKLEKRSRVESAPSRNPSALVLQQLIQIMLQRDNLGSFSSYMAFKRVHPSWLSSITALEQGYSTVNSEGKGMWEQFCNRCFPRMNVLPGDLQLALEGEAPEFAAEIYAAGEVRTEAVRAKNPDGFWFLHARRMWQAIAAFQLNVFLPEETITDKLVGVPEQGYTLRREKDMSELSRDNLAEVLYVYEDNAGSGVFEFSLKQLAQESFSRIDPEYESHVSKCHEFIFTFFESAANTEVGVERSAPTMSSYKYFLGVQNVARKQWSDDNYFGIQKMEWASAIRFKQSIFVATSVGTRENARKWTELFKYLVKGEMSDVGLASRAPRYRLRGKVVVSVNFKDMNYEQSASLYALAFPNKAADFAEHLLGGDFDSIQQYKKVKCNTDGMAELLGKNSSYYGERRIFTDFLDVARHNYDNYGLLPEQYARVYSRVKTLEYFFDALENGYSRKDSSGRGLWQRFVNRCFENFDNKLPRDLQTRKFEGIEDAAWRVVAQRIWHWSENTWFSFTTEFQMTDMTAGPQSKLSCGATTIEYGEFDSQREPPEGYTDLQVALADFYDIVDESVYEGVESSNSGVYILDVDFYRTISGTEGAICSEDSPQGASMCDMVRGIYYEYAMYVPDTDVPALQELAKKIESGQLDGRRYIEYDDFDHIESTLAYGGSINWGDADSKWCESIHEALMKESGGEQREWGACRNSSVENYARRFGKNALRNQIVSS